MLNKSAKKITDILLSHQIISSEQYDIYVYGFELLVSFLFSTMLILIAGIVLGTFVRTIAFLAVFIILRSYTGGFHAKTYLVCTIFTLSTYGAVMLLSFYVKINIIAFSVLLVLGLIVLFIFSPVENPNKPLSDKQKKKYKLIGLLLYVIFCVFGAWMTTVSPVVGSTVFFALIADMILLFIPLFMKGGHSNA